MVSEGLAIIWQLWIVYLLFSFICCAIGKVIKLKVAITILPLQLVISLWNNMSELLWPSDLGLKLIIIIQPYHLYFSMIKINNDIFNVINVVFAWGKSFCCILLKMLHLCNSVIHFKYSNRTHWSMSPSEEVFLNSLKLHCKPRNNFLLLFKGVGLNSTTQSVLSRPMQRKLVTLVHCQLVEEEGRIRAMRAARSLGERTVTELILQHQNPQQLSSNLWAAVRARGCQFLGPGIELNSIHNTLVILKVWSGDCKYIQRLVHCKFCCFKQYSTWWLWLGWFHISFSEHLTFPLMPEVYSFW